MAASAMGKHSFEETWLKWAVSFTILKAVRIRYRVTLPFFKATASLPTLVSSTHP
jgi:hypothetical protein